MTVRAKARQPLAAAGRALVASMTSELGDHAEFDARELALIDTAARLADRLAALETMIEQDGLRLLAGNGTIRVHPGAAEHRQTALALAKTLDAVRLPDETATGLSPASIRKSRAANRRWDAARALRDGDGAA